MPRQQAAWRLSWLAKLSWRSNVLRGTATCLPLLLPRLLRGKHSQRRRFLSQLPKQRLGPSPRPSPNQQLQTHPSTTLARLLLVVQLLLQRMLQQMVSRTSATLEPTQLQLLEEGLIGMPALEAAVFNSPTHLLHPDLQILAILVQLLIAATLLALQILVQLLIAATLL